MIDNWHLNWIEAQSMQFQAQLRPLLFLRLFQKEQPVEDIRVYDEFVQFLYEKFVFNIEGLDKHDKDVDIVWIIFAFLVFTS